MIRQLLNISAILFTASLFAQQVDIVSVDDLTTSLNGSEQTVNGNPSDVNIYKDMKVVNNGSEAITISLRRVELANSGVLDQICYDDILCVDASGEIYTIPSDITIEPGANSQFKPQIVPDDQEACVINKYEVITPFGVVLEEITVKFTAGSASCNLSTENNLAVNTFEFFPNPAKESIKVSFDAQSKASIQVVDALGKIVVNKNVLSGSEIAVNHLNNGVYFVQLISDYGVVERKKLIIKH